jgi:glycosyltransferase involved in cell wall biosynthesis
MPPRVLFLTVMPSPYQRELFKALHADERVDIQVWYYTKSASDRNWSLAPLSSYEQILRGTTLKWLGSSAHLNYGIARLLKEDSSDIFVISDYSAPTTQIAMRLLTRYHKPWVFWGEVPGLNQRGRIGTQLRNSLQRPISRGATAVAAIGSEAVVAYTKLFAGLHVFNVPYFCDLAPFRAAASSRVTRGKATIDLLFSGQLTKRKGIDILVQAFLQVSDLVPQLRLRIVGAGMEFDTLTRMIPDRSRHRIEFLGFQQPEALPEIFAASDLFVLPSRHDGWGVVVNEALGSGLPLITSDRVGARDLVEDGRNGFIVPAERIDLLATALLKLGQSEGLRDAFGRVSAQRSKSWDVDEGVRRWVRLFKSVLAS